MILPFKSGSEGAAQAVVLSRRHFSFPEQFIPTRRVIPLHVSTASFRLVAGAGCVPPGAGREALEIFDDDSKEEGYAKNRSACSPRIAFITTAVIGGLVAAQEKRGEGRSPPDDCARPGPPRCRGRATRTARARLSITLNQGQKEVCFELTVSDIAAATLAHIAQGGRRSPPAPVVTMTPPAEGTSKGVRQRGRET